jgi:plastocyanin
MKVDLSKLPVGEAIIGFLIIALAITFLLAFQAIDDDDGGDAAAGEVTPAPTEDGEGTPPPGGTEVVMGDNFFEPAELTVPAGETVTFSLTNEGSAIHNMRIDDPAGEVISDPDTIRGGETATLEWTAPSEPGEVPFLCEFHATQMTGTITVQ